jgi:6-phosphogluconolactonase
MNKIVEVLPDKDALIQRSLAVVLDKIQAAIAERGLCTIALAGGSTPKPLYEQLATHDLSWDNIHIFWGDERYVPADHPDSNEGMARHAWLDQVAVSACEPSPDANSQP